MMFYLISGQNSLDDVINTMKTYSDESSIILKNKTFLVHYSFLSKCLVCRINCRFGGSVASHRVNYWLGETYVFLNAHS